MLIGGCVLETSEGQCCLNVENSRASVWILDVQILKRRHFGQDHGWANPFEVSSHTSLN